MVNWGNGFVMSQYFVEVFDIGSCQSMDWISRDGVNMYIFWIYCVCYIVYVCFQRCFCQIYNVVVWDSVFSVKVGKGQQGRIWIQYGVVSFCYCNEVVGVDVVGNFEVFMGNGVNIVIIQLIVRCKINRVYEIVKFWLNFFQFSEYGVDVGIFCNIVLQNDVRI